MKKHYTIQKGVEPAKSGRSFGKLLDLSKMEEGDSFTFPIVDEARVKALTNSYGLKNGASFLITMQESTCTCWRAS